MTAPDHDSADQPTDRLTEDELDALLAATHDDLVGYARRHTNPTTTLLALMAADDQPTPSAQINDHLVRTINWRTSARILAHALTRDQDLAHELVRDLALELDRDLVLDLELALELACALDSVLTLVFDRDRDLNLDRARARALDRAFALDRALTRALDHALDRDRARARAFALERDRVFVRDFARALNHGLLRDRDHALDLACDLADILVRELDAVPADVSGADLSGLHVPYSEVLAGVVWDKATVWPAHLREHVQDRSDPIGNGRYRIRGGTERDPHDLTTA